jgi:hypothetical protein
MEVKLRAALPALVSVTICAVLVDPTFSDANVRLLGESVTAGAVATPMPVRAIFWGEPDALSVTVSVAVRVPAAEGVKVTESSQFEPTATLLPQVLVTPKSAALLPVREILSIVSAAVPEFESSDANAGLVDPTI